MSDENRIKRLEQRCDELDERMKHTLKEIYDIKERFTSSQAKILETTTKTMRQVGVNHKDMIELGNAVVSNTKALNALYHLYKDLQERTASPPESDAETIQIFALDAKKEEEPN